MPFLALNLPPGRRIHQTVTILLMAVFLGFSARAAEISFPASMLTIGARQFTVEEARTPVQQERGLMFRKNLPADHGMLFIFESPQPVQMWMKNTLIPLDMLFINKQGKIIYIAKNAIPESEAVITAGVPVKAVLELAGGACEKQGIKTGDVITHAAFTSRPAY